MWECFDAMDSILGHRPAIVIDTSTSRPVIQITPFLSEGEEEVGEDDEEEHQATRDDSEAGSLNSSAQSLANIQTQESINGPQSRTTL